MNPISALYGVGAGLRNLLFDRGVFPSRRLKLPVVSVGNLSVGGTGKTPFVIALGELLLARGIRFDVLSRGYRRKTRGILVVDPAGNAADFGDEPLLIARRLGVPVIVGESRYEAGCVAEQKFSSQLHLLDDGFQHRSLARDFDIVLLKERDFADRLLPFGRMREPLSSLARADAIVLPHHSSATDFSANSLTVEDLAGQGTLTWRVHRSILLPTSPASPVVFCGIGDPQQFFAQLRAAGITPAAEIEFRDHCAYKKNDIQHLLTLRRKSGADGFLTTEKDAVNLGSLQSALAPLSVAVLRVTLDDAEAIVDTILAKLTLTNIAKSEPLS